jgi:hypothetical protein
MIPTKIELKTAGYESYIADVIIGTPPMTYRLQISFSFDDLILYKNLEFESTSYCEMSGGNDLLHIGSEIYRIPIISDPRKQLITNESYCENCVGILGLGGGSVFWKIWPQLSFSRNSIYLNTINPEFTSNHNGEVYILNCDDPQMDGSLCKFTGNISFGKEVYPNIVIEFKLLDENMYIPQEIYDAYMKNKNIYTSSKWEEMHIHYNTHSFQSNIKPYDHFGTFKKTFKIDFNPQKYIRSVINGGKKFGIKISSTNSIQIGVDILKHFIFHKNIYNSEVIIKHIDTTDTLSLVNVILIGILVWLLMKWMITDINSVSEMNVSYKNKFWSIIFELIGIGIAITSYVLPSTLRVLAGYRVLYILSGVFLGITLIFKIISMGISFSYKKGYSKRYEVFENTVIRSLTQEILLLFGLWLLLIERRLALTSTALVLIVNVYLIYRITFYLIITTLYSFYKKGKEKTALFLLFYLLVILLYIYQILATINFFIRPIFVRDFQLYENVIVPFLIILYFFIISFAVYMTRLYFKKASSILLLNLQKSNSILLN